MTWPIRSTRVLPHRLDKCDGRLAALGECVVDRSAVGLFVDKAVDAQFAQVPGRGLDVQVQALGARVERQPGLAGQQEQQGDAVVVGKATDNGFELFGFRKRQRLVRIGLRRVVRAGLAEVLFRLLLIGQLIILSISQE